VFARCWTNTSVQQIQPNVLVTSVSDGESSDVQSVQQVPTNIHVTESSEIPSVRQVQSNVHVSESGEVPDVHVDESGEVPSVCVTESSVVSADDKHCLRFTTDEAFHGGGCLRLSATADGSRLVTK